MELFKTDTPAQGQQALLERLEAELSAGKRVLWLFGGGSSLIITVRIMAAISEELSHNLTVGLTDERFGPAGHPDSNWKQLLDLGFDAKSARKVTVLGSNQGDLADTANQYGEVLADLFAEHDVVVGQYGMGPDGHIAGILPHTSAVTAKGLVTGYHTDPYERITSTFEAIKHCAVAYLFAFGDNKRPVLEHLTQELSLDEQPAQILKQLPEARVYNDQIGGTV